MAGVKTKIIVFANKNKHGEQLCRVLNHPKFLESCNRGNQRAVAQQITGVSQFGRYHAPTFHSNQYIAERDIRKDETVFEFSAGKFRNKLNDKEIHTPVLPFPVYASGSKFRVDRKSIPKCQFKLYPNAHVVATTDIAKGEKLFVSLADAWSGYLHQCIEYLKNDKIDILIASDGVSRGVDIPVLTMVIHLDPPLSYRNPLLRKSQEKLLDKETFEHRTGRVGRFGKYGTCVCLEDSARHFDQGFKSGTSNAITQRRITKPRSDLVEVFDDGQQALNLAMKSANISAAGSDSVEVNFRILYSGETFKVHVKSMTAGSKVMTVAELKAILGEVDWDRTCLVFNGEQLSQDRKKLKVVSGSTFDIGYGVRVRYGRSGYPGTVYPGRIVGLSGDGGFVIDLDEVQPFRIVPLDDTSKETLRREVGGTRKVFEIKQKDPVAATRLILDADSTLRKAHQAQLDTESADLKEKYAKDGYIYAAVEALPEEERGTQYEKIKHSQLDNIGSIKRQINKQKKFKRVSKVVQDMLINLADPCFTRNGRGGRKASKKFSGGRMIFQRPNGSGKTGAIAIAVLKSFQPKVNKGPQIIVVTNHAINIPDMVDTIRKFGESVLSSSGEKDSEIQHLSSFTRPDRLKARILVTTFQDLFFSRVDLSTVHTLIFDEADAVLNNPNSAEAERDAERLKALLGQSWQYIRYDRGNKKTNDGKQRHPKNQLSAGVKIILCSATFHKSLVESAMFQLIMFGRKLELQDNLDGKPFINTLIDTFAERDEVEKRRLWENKFDILVDQQANKQRTVDLFYCVLNKTGKESEDDLLQSKFNFIMTLYRQSFLGATPTATKDAPPKPPATTAPATTAPATTAPTTTAPAVVSTPADATSTSNPLDADQMDAYT